MTEDKKDFVPNPSYKIYKPNKTGNGAACQLELGKNGLFLTFANQVPGEDKNGNFQFNWKEKITISIGENDIATVLGFITRPSETPAKLFHKIEGKGDKIIELKHNKETGNYYISVSSRVGEATKRAALPLSFGEALVIKKLLENAITKLIF